jgi:hypothetical protein
MRAKASSLILGFLVKSAPSGMAKQPTFRTGDPIPQTGIYRVIHKLHRLPHEVTLLRNQDFPRCAKCKDAVKFELARAVSERMNHQDFRIYLYELDEEGADSVAV